jgi:beta-phosphoglucomutase
MDEVNFRRGRKRIVYKAILFDYDGTLVQSMQCNFIAWQKALKDFDINIVEDDYLPLEGMSVKNLADHYINKYNIGAPNTTIANILVQKKEAYFKGTFTFITYRGVDSFLNLCESKKVTMVIVTTGLFDRIFFTTPLKFLSKFKFFITGDRFSNKRDAYLNAAENLKIKPEECLVIENAPLGIKAAKEAGMHVIGISTTVDKKYLIEADSVINSFNEILNVKEIQEIFNAK